MSPLKKSIKPYITLILLLVTGITYAGSADAIIRGETSSKRTAIEVHVGDITGLISYVKWTVDGKTYEIKEGEGLPQTVIKDTENGVYLLTISSKDKDFKLWMIPGTEKILEKTGSGMRTQFAAVIEASDPREKGKWTLTPRITIGCKLDYSI